MPQQVSALERIIEPRRGSLPLPLAEYLLTLKFSNEDHARYQELSDKAQQGSLSDAEKVELDDLLTANDVLTILKSKARASLQRQNPAA